MLWLAVRNEKYSGCQFCIVVGPNIDLAKKLIKRMRNIIRDIAPPETDTQTALEVNNVWIQAFPSNHLDAYRSLDKPKFIFLDESDFWRKSEVEDVRHVSERYIGKSNPDIVMVSTPNRPDGLMQMIEQEETSIYHRIRLGYQLGLGKIYTESEIEQAKLSPSFAREYDLQYGFGLGNIFLNTEIDAACSIAYNADKINRYSPISMGIDPGFGSSKFSFCILQLQNDRLEVLYSKEFERPSYEDMLNLAVQLNAQYRPQKIYIDGAKIDFIKSLKIQLHETVEYDKVIEKAKHDKVNPEYRMKVFPINFNEHGKELLGMFQNLVSKGWFALSRTEHRDLVVQMRTAKAKENGNLEKDEVGGITYDALDAARLALRMFNMPRR